MAGDVVTPSIFNPEDIDLYFCDVMAGDSPVKVIARRNQLRSASPLLNKLLEKSTSMLSLPLDTDRAMHEFISHVETREIVIIDDYHAAEILTIALRVQMESLVEEIVRYAKTRDEKFFIFIADIACKIKPLSIPK